MTAMTAGGPLRRSDPNGTGIRRRRRGRGLTYLGADATAVKDPRTLARIKALVIPPAWRDVWICADPRGHIQAIGTDAAGRRQYRYHDLWRLQRTRTSMTGFSTSGAPYRPYARPSVSIWRPGAWPGNGSWRQRYA